MLIIDTAELSGDTSSLSQSEVYWTYNGLDCCITREVFDAIEPQLDEVTRPTYRLAMDLTAPLLEMMLEGMPVSSARKATVLSDYRTRLERLEKLWQRLCVEVFDLPPDRAKRKGAKPLAINYNSPKDVQFLFHELLGVPQKRKRKKGKDEASVTTDRDTLEGFRSYFYAIPFVNLILSMRDQRKAIGFLMTKLDDDNRIRCSFNVAGTNTGRLSSSFSDMGRGTNLQNISGKLKDIFEAPHGYAFVDVDLEQGDSRGVGAIAWNFFVESHGEEWAGRYLDACESGDLHTTVCRMAWTNLSWGEDEAKWKSVAQQPAYRDHSYRDLSKKLGHGSNYLVQPATASAATHLPVGMIRDFQRNYFSAFPCVPAWQDETIRLVKTTRCLTSPWGRRRYFWSDPSAQTTLNEAIAYSPQNTTGEFTNRGMLQLWLYRNAHNLPIRFLLQVHDSLLFLIPEKQINELIPIILANLRVKLLLKKGREFTIPHGVKCGWNYGSYNEKTNPFGLKVWTGEETRKRPRDFHYLDTILSQPAKNIR